MNQAVSRETSRALASPQAVSPSSVFSEGPEHPIIESTLGQSDWRRRWNNLDLPDIIGDRLEDTLASLSENNRLLPLTRFIQGEEVEGLPRDLPECLNRLAAITRAP